LWAAVFAIGTIAYFPAFFLWRDWQWSIRGRAHILGTGLAAAVTAYGLSLLVVWLGEQAFGKLWFYRGSSRVAESFEVAPEALRQTYLQNEGHKSFLAILGYFIPPRE